MLEDSAYVRAILVDFTKAFDIADHTFLMSKLAELQPPGNIDNWVGSFLSARQQVCRYNGTVSELESFNLGFVQGSGLGLTLFLVLSQYLNSLSNNNELTKFAVTQPSWCHRTQISVWQQNSPMYRTELSISIIVC